MVLSSLQSGWLMLLAGVWAVLLFGSYTIPRLAAGRNSHRTSLLLSSAVLVLAGWSWCLAARHTPLRMYALLIALGVTCGLLGDLFMAGVLRARGRLVAGMGSFGAGHLFYIGACLVLARDLRIPSLNLAGPWLAWLLVAAAAWYIVIYRGQPAGVLHWVALPYALLLASTTGLATGLALHSSLLLPFALGAMLFLVSDFLIALREFTGRRSRLIVDGVWLTYGPAQALIVFSAAFASALPPT